MSIIIRPFIRQFRTSTFQPVKELFSSRHLTTAGTRMRLPPKIGSCRSFTLQHPFSPSWFSSFVQSRQCSSVSAGRVSGDQLTEMTVLGTELKGEGERVMVVQWNDGKEMRYPYVWLRDSCQCQDCVDLDTGTRKFDFNQLDIDTVPVKVETLGTSQQVHVTWSDGHCGSFSYSWLRNRGFNSATGAKTSSWRGKRRVLWRGSDMSRNIPRFNFTKLLSDDGSLYSWLTTMEETGLALIVDAPTEKGQLEKVASRVDFLRAVCFGTTSYVHVKANPSNLAYLSPGPHVLHNDLAYYHFMPGMQMMHCVSQVPTGGESTVVDGFQVAQQLKEEDPEKFRLLSSLYLHFFFAGQDFLEFNQMTRHPIIELDEPSGELLRINYSTHGRDSFMRMSIDKVEPFYMALKTFTDIMYDPKNFLEYRLRPGDIICFDNWRVLHGRNSYQPAPGYERLLEHGYIEWDEMHSRRRVLEQRLNTHVDNELRD